MKIGIIGSGNMGRAIGVRLSHAGHEVAFGARREEQAREAASRATSSSFATTVQKAAELGDILVWTARVVDPRDVLDDLDAMVGKTVIDLNNRSYDKVRDGTWFSESIAEQLQAHLPGSSVVKAFNTIPMEVFDIPSEDLQEASATVFVAGGGDAARNDVCQLAQDIGFKSADLGSGVAALRAAEALGDAIRLMLIDGGQHISTHLSISHLPRPSLGSIGQRQVSQYG